MPQDQPKTEVKIYTDGSFKSYVPASKCALLVGAFTVYLGDKKIHQATIERFVSVNLKSYSYQAEGLAIIEACRWVRRNLVEKTRLVLISDYRSFVQLFNLEKGKFSTKKEVSFHEEKFFDHELKPSLDSVVAKFSFTYKYQIEKNEPRLKECHFLCYYKLKELESGFFAKLFAVKLKARMLNGAKQK